MKKSNKGITIVELVVSISILSIVVLFLFQLILSLKEVYTSSGVKTEMLNKQAIINREINEDLINKQLELARSCSSSADVINCISFYFKDGTSKRLEFIKKTDNTPAYLIYGDYKTELVSGSDYNFDTVNYNIKATTMTDVTDLTNDSILSINVPIMHPDIKDDYGIHLVYQYNSNNTSITNLAISGNDSAEEIWLAGSSNMIWYSTVEFVDPGYYYLDSNNNIIKATSTTDAVTVTRSTIVDNKMTVTYTPVSNPNKAVTRTVTFISTSYTYDVNNSYYTFSVPVSGSYKIELWGANGNSSGSFAGGTGAYTSGNITLTAGEKIYVYVGGAGSGDNGGYNGGGSLTLNQSTQNGAAGGGATDIRLKKGNWDSIDGLRSRIMVAAGGGGALPGTCGSSKKTGGFGGSITSNSNTIGTACTDSMYTIALGASQVSGGSIDVYSAAGAKLNTYASGKFGMSSKPDGYEGDIKAGGGGGYFGGASSGYGSSATGGSSFVSGYSSSKAIDSNGNITDSNIHYSGKKFDNISVIDGESLSSSMAKPTSGNNGYARISLSSINFNSNNVTNKKKIVVTIGDKTESKNITNEVTTFDLTNYNLNNYNHILCNNGATIKLENSLLTVDNITTDTNCTISDDFVTTINSLDTSKNSITLINDVELTKNITISTNRTVNLEMNGKTILNNTIFGIVGTLNLYDSTKLGKIVVNGSGNGFNLGSNAKLNIDYINIVQDYDNTSSAKDGIWISSGCNGCEVTIKDANIDVGGYAVGVHGNATNSKVDILNGTYKSQNKCIANNGNNFLNINNGNFYSSSHFTVINYGNGEININGGTYISAKKRSIGNEKGTINIKFQGTPIYISSTANEWAPAILNNSGTMNITGNIPNKCTSSSDSTTNGICIYGSTNNGGIQNYSGSVNVDGVYIYGNAQAFNSGTGIINILNSTIVSEKYPIFNNTSSTFNICNSTINSNSNYDLYSNGGTINYSSSVVFTSGNNTPVIVGKEDTVIGNYSGTCKTS